MHPDKRSGVLLDLEQAGEQGVLKDVEAVASSSKPANGRNEAGNDSFRIRAASRMNVPGVSGLSPSALA
jgi:hypothetical protein